LSPSHFVVNGVTEIFANENALFDYYNVQSQHNLTCQVSGVYISQKKTVSFRPITSPCNAVMHETIFLWRSTMSFASPISMDFIWPIKTSTSTISHLSIMPTQISQSNELFKGVLDDQASGSFTGSIIVRPDDSKKQNAYQSNKNLLLQKMLSSTPSRNSKSMPMT
jgi:ABC-type transport system involved in Fe-S cluster assembly, permease component